MWVVIRDAPRAWLVPVARATGAMQSFLGCEELSFWWKGIRKAGKENVPFCKSLAVLCFALEGNALSPALSLILSSETSLLAELCWDLHAERIDTWAHRLWDSHAEVLGRIGHFFIPLKESPVGRGGEG